MQFPAELRGRGGGETAVPGGDLTQDGAEDRPGLEEEQPAQRHLRRPSPPASAAGAPGRPVVLRLSPGGGLDGAEVVPGGRQAGRRPQTLPAARDEARGHRDCLGGERAGRDVEDVEGDKR